MLRRFYLDEEGYLAFQVISPIGFLVLHSWIAQRINGISAVMMNDKILRLKISPSEYS